MSLAQYKESSGQGFNHSDEGSRRERTYTEESSSREPVSLGHQIRDTATIEAISIKMPSCDDCELELENMHGLQKHVKSWCSEQFSLKRKNEEDDENAPRKKIRYERMLTDEIKYSPVAGDDADENGVYAKFAEMAKEHNEKEWQEKRDKYVEEGMSDTEAEKRADLKLKEEDL